LIEFRPYSVGLGLVIAALGLGLLYYD